MAALKAAGTPSAGLRAGSACLRRQTACRTPAERQFLSGLKAELGGTLDGTEAQADGLAREADTPGTDTRIAAALARLLARHLTALRWTRASSTAPCSAAAHWSCCRKGWASVAIIPLQVELVRWHSRRATASATSTPAWSRSSSPPRGVGLTGQYLEQFGRKLVGGLLLGSGAGPGWAAAWAALGTGMAMSFATTYALGQLAVRCYGGGRQMSSALLQQTYQDLLVSARQFAAGGAACEIRQQARTLDAGKVLEMVHANKWRDPPCARWSVGRRRSPEDPLSEPLTVTGKRRPISRLRQ